MTEGENGTPRREIDGAILELLADGESHTKANLSKAIQSNSGILATALRRMKIAGTIVEGSDGSKRVYRRPG